MKLRSAFFLLLTFVSQMLVFAQYPSQYKGKPYSDSIFVASPQHIPGRIELAYYDIGGEGVAYHDKSSKNEGSVLNREVHSYGSHHRPGIDHRTAFFRENEGVDISYTKDWIDFSEKNIVHPAVNQLYIGWQEDGEWTNYTVNVRKAGKYKIITSYANVDNRSEIWINNKLATRIILPQNTGNWHFWTQAIVAEIEFKQEGLNLLTLKYNEGANLAYLDFVLIEAYN